MRYDEYKISRNLAWEILIHEQISALPFSVSAICKHMGIRVMYYVPEDDNSGFSTIVDGKPVIFVSQTEGVERQRFTAAHELGHILLGHVGKYQLVNREPSSSDNPIEQAANVFASRLLAPACVLWGCGVTAAEEIAALCHISKQAAEYRMQRMKILYERGMFLTSELERLVYQNFQGYIETNRL